MNIYSDIHPFKETAIYLGPNSAKAKDRYINANRIKSIIYNEKSEQDQNLMIAA